MKNKDYKRRVKEDKPVLALCYDFDKTLTPDDMQAQGFIQEVGYDVKDFWEKSNEMAQNNDMDGNLAYMYNMLQESEGTMIFNKEKLADYGSKVELFPGVEDWFDRINNYGKDHGVIVEHYIISSGLKEMIEGTSIAKKGAFEKIYACSFYYNKKNVAKWPAQVVNYTNKTQFLFRIEKGVLDINDPGVNDYFPEDKLRVPFRNIVYIGDSDTDVPCMKLVNIYGGHSIGVYNPTSNNKTKVYQMMKDNRIKYFVPANYSNGSEIDELIKKIIIKTAENEKLESIHYKYAKEVDDLSKKANDEDNNAKKHHFINSLENSRSFATTHTVIKELKDLNNLTDEDKEELFNIAIKNQQIYLILNDKDINNFYRTLLNETTNLSEAALKLKKILSN